VASLELFVMVPLPPLPDVVVTVVGSVLLNS